MASKQKSIEDLRSLAQISYSEALSITEITVRRQLFYLPSFSSANVRRLAVYGLTSMPVR